ncbi:MAG: hypothetical protein GPOALKHO_001952 [Sodalis sp.]|nr:MAG: hypothetical protein GPOALKHO_001952 [Sodalis sp.]
MPALASYRTAFYLEVENDALYRSWIRFMPIRSTMW